MISPVLVIHPKCCFSVCGVVLGQKLRERAKIKQAVRPSQHINTYFRYLLQSLYFMIDVLKKKKEVRIVFY